MAALDGRSLDLAGLSRLVRGSGRVPLDVASVERAARAATAPAGPAYGRTTGVGANRDVLVPSADRGHALRLWASHAAGAGPLLGHDEVRAMISVRVNQVLAGPTGLSAACAGSLADALVRGFVPAVHRYGAVGTGDLTALAELGLCLAGRRPWWRGEGDPPRPVEPEPGDGLALLSSNALTLGVAALAACDLERLARAGVAVAALTCLASGAAADAYSPVAWPRRRDSAPAGHGADAPQSAHLSPRQPDPGPATADGASWVAGVLAHALVGHGRRLQDPYPLRAAPAWHGPLVAALAELSAELTVGINTSLENPIADAETGAWTHHAGLLATGLTARLDAVRSALVTAAHGSLSRTRALHNPEITGLPAFLASGPRGSSGTMTCEYAAAAGCAELAQLAHPAATGWVTLSMGHEDGAAFATQAAFAARDSVIPYTTVLAVELLVAVRALRLAGWPGGETGERASGWLSRIAERAVNALPADLGDHDLGPDIQAATDILPDLAGAVLRDPVES
ncbi:MAG: aromatic amino acid lyase [Acidimicrobiaceae bacterium]|nr:aromatic amino acid lyase [Acidimicrobiaceae bacterium]